MPHSQEQVMVSLTVGGAYRFAKLWKIEPVVGTILYITDTDHPVNFEGNNYEPQDGIQASAVQSGDATDPDNFIASGIISSSRIKEVDLIRGVYRRAKITEVVVDHRFSWAGTFVRRVYFLGQIKFNPKTDFWEAQCEGLMSRLEQRRGWTYDRRCRWNLGDSDCTVNIVALKTNITVASVNTDGSFIVAPSIKDEDEYWDDGKIIWTVGNNINTTQVIKRYTTDDNIWILAEKPPFDILATDRGDVFPGCNKKPGVNIDGTADITGHCLHRFTNLTNFGGFPFLPSNDKLFITPDAKTT